MAASTTSCEYNITCELPEYSEATRKQGEHEIYVFTYMKDTLHKVFPCSLKSQYLCAEGELFWTESGHCKCWKTNNQFLLGIEHMTLTIRHAFDPLRKLSQPLTIDQRSGKNIPMLVVRDHMDGDVVHTFEAGEIITATMQQWLKWAGVESLEEINSKALSQYPPTVMIPGSYNKPTYRMTGIELNIELNYKGHLGGRGKADIECRMVLKVVEGYHSFGSDPVYQVYKDSNGAKTIHDRYTRGVRVLLSAQGRIGEFDINHLLFLIPALLVYIALAPTVTEYIFYYLGWLCEVINLSCRRNEHRQYAPNVGDFLAYESQSWHQSCDENVDLDGFHARRLLNTLMLKMLFQKTYQKERISYQEALTLMVDLITQSKTAKSSTVELANLGKKDEEDEKRRTTRLLTARDAETLISWLFHVAHPELHAKPVQQRSLSINRFAALITGGVEHPSLPDCLTHAGLNADVQGMMKMKSVELTTLVNRLSAKAPVDPTRPDPPASDASIVTMTGFESATGSKSEVTPTGDHTDDSDTKLPGEVGE